MTFFILSDLSLIFKVKVKVRSKSFNCNLLVDLLNLLKRSVNFMYTIHKFILLYHKQNSDRELFSSWFLMYHTTFQRMEMEFYHQPFNDHSFLAAIDL